MGSKGCRHQGLCAKQIYDPAYDDALSKDAREHLEKFRSKNKEMLDALGKRKVMAQPFDMLFRIVIGNKRVSEPDPADFDQVGKQVRWLMYHIELAGIKNYYFLEKGANSIIGIQAYGKM